MTFAKLTHGASVFLDTNILVHYFQLRFSNSR